MALVLADENMPLPVCTALRELGHDLITASEAGLANRSVPDVEVLAYALAHGRVVITHDRRDYLRLHQQGAVHAGIVICTFDPDFVRQATLIHEQIDRSPMTGRLVKVYRPA